MREWFTILKEGYEQQAAIHTLIRSAASTLNTMKKRERKAANKRHPEGTVIELSKVTYTVQKDGSWRKNA